MKHLDVAVWLQTNYSNSHYAFHGDMNSQADVDATMEWYDTIVSKPTYSQIIS